MSTDQLLAQATQTKLEELDAVANSIRAEIEAQERALADLRLRLTNVAQERTKVEAVNALYNQRPADAKAEPVIFEGVTPLVLYVVAGREPEGIENEDLIRIGGDFIKHQRVRTTSDPSQPRRIMVATIGYLLKTRQLQKNGDGKLHIGPKTAGIPTEDAA